jgi:hypothetical protein
MSLLSLAGTALRLALGLVGIWNRIAAWFTTRAEMQAGADAQAAAETRAAEASATAIAEALASAPKTDDAIDARLKDHSI